MKKRLWKSIIFLLAVALCVSLSACNTEAWFARKTTGIEASTTDSVVANGSEKYIVYAALDDSGNLIASDASTAVAAYAVVGYTGLVAELVIPAQYNGKNVTKVLSIAPYSAYKCYRNGAAYTGDDSELANNEVITSIVFGSNVAYVAPAACLGIMNLTTITFMKNTSTVTLGESAFMYCASLATIRFKASSSSVTIGTDAFTGCANSTPTYNYGS